eukprot:2489324-Rhodomonas_salina.2
MINNLATLDNDSKEAWIAAKSHIQATRLANGTVHMEEVLAAIVQAEDSAILRDTTSHHQQSQAAAITANRAVTMPAAEAQPSVADMATQLAKMKTMLAEAQQSGSATYGKPHCNCKRQCTGMGGDRKTQHCSKQCNSSVMYTYQECKKCGCHH